MLKTDFSKIPSSIGVYLFLKNKTPIYIGKTINLRVRLNSHLRNSQTDKKTALIFKSVDSIKTILAPSELNALLIEAALIQKFKPKYNVIWKDNKSYLYIKISLCDKYPKIYPIRLEDDKRFLYFGPFSSARMVYQLLREIRKVIPFCSQHKISKAPCFYSKIGLCNPCPNMIQKISDTKLKKITTQKYRANIQKIILILKGKSSIVLDVLKKNMNQYSQNENYEKALVIRNKITFLTELIETRSFSKHEVDSLTTNAFSKIRLETINFIDRYFHIAKFTNTIRIECYDVSHLFGESMTASMVVFINGMPSKKDYRRFQIKTVHKISDTDALKEALVRRLKRKEWVYPDLIVVDGGKPQVRVFTQILQKFNPNIPHIGFAKNPDRIFLGNSFKSLYLSPDSAFFLSLRHIRDESHRFAKKYHLLLRKKRMMYN